jgi:hypothetical protein
MKEWRWCFSILVSSGHPASHKSAAEPSKLEYPVVLLMCYRLYGFYRIFFPVSVDKSPGGEGVNVVPNSQRGKRFNR